MKLAFSFQFFFIIAFFLLIFISLADLSPVHAVAQLFQDPSVEIILEDNVGRAVL
jgi:hypothetical protein